MANIIDQIEKENMKDNIPAFNVGDTVRVGVKIKEGDKERVQAYEGVVIAKKNGGIRETFTVRKISNGVGVERTFPLQSPLIAGVEIVRKGRPRRAKLYYVRELTGKAAKIPQKSNQQTTNNARHRTSGAFFLPSFLLFLSKFAIILQYE